eukprot:3931930-Rhodomonas_salina.2
MRLDGKWVVAVSWQRRCVGSRMREGSEQSRARERERPFRRAATEPEMTRRVALKLGYRSWNSVSPSLDHRWLASNRRRHAQAGSESV